MQDAERKTLVDLRRALLHLHKTLVDWERAAYERAHGRRSPPELLKLIVSDPHFAWLRPLTELIVRIDTALEADAPDTPLDADALVTHARTVVAPDDPGSAYSQRYRDALQEHPDAVVAHGSVAKLLKDAPTRKKLH